MQEKHALRAVLLRLTFVFVILLFIGSLTACAKIRHIGWYKDYGIESKNELEKTSSVPSLIRALNDKDAHIRLFALKILAAKHPDALSVSLLIKSLYDNSAPIRIYALRLIARKGPEAVEAGPVIEPFLIDSNRSIRIVAIGAIKDIKYYEGNVLGILKEIASSDQNETVRIRAADTVRIITLYKLSQKNKLIVDVSSKKETQKEGVRLIPNFYASPRQSDVAVVIGIEDYQNISRKSDYSYNDAVLVKEYLIALGFQERNIEFLTNERATGNGLRKSLEAWLPNNVKEDSRVLIYYSGHGAPDTKGNGYIVPYDGDPSYLEITGYPLDNLYASLEKLDVSEIIVVMDSCFSGAGGKSVLPEGVRPLSMDIENPILASGKIAVLSSSEMDQISTSFPEQKLGIFTYHFLKALQDGKMTLSEIHSYIKPLVEDEAKRMNIEQSPQLLPSSALPDNKFSLR